MTENCVHRFDFVPFKGIVCAQCDAVATTGTTPPNHVHSWPAERFGEICPGCGLIWTSERSQVPVASNTKAQVYVPVPTPGWPSELVSLKDYHDALRQIERLTRESEAWDKASLVAIIADRDRLTVERDQLLTAIGGHVTVRSDQHAKIERLTRERDEFKTWWQRDSGSLSKALNQLSLERACKEDFRAADARLRTALTKIQSLHSASARSNWDLLKRAMRIANDALSDEPDSAPETPPAAASNEQFLDGTLKFGSIAGSRTGDPSVLQVVDPSEGQQILLSVNEARALHLWLGMVLPHSSAPETKERRCRECKETWIEGDEYCRQCGSREPPEETPPDANRAYYEIHEPPHCPTCDCGVPDGICTCRDVLVVNGRCTQCRRPIRASEKAPETAASLQAPAVRVVIENGKVAYTTIYDPGLPDGTHDLYCEPEAVAPMMRDETAAKSRNAHISNLTVRLLDAAYVVTWQEDGEPCGSETISEKLAYALVRADGGVSGITDDRPPLKASDLPSTNEKEG